MTNSKIDLSVEFCGVHFENPFILAAAPPTDELDIVRAGLRAGWAGAVLKTTSTEETSVPLVYPMMSGLDWEEKKIIGMGNIDLISEYHINELEKRIKILKEEFPNKVIICSMMGSTKEDWQTLAHRISKAGADLIECSFSCPQGTLGSKPGFMLGQDAKLVETVAGWVKEASSVPVIIKITPVVSDIIEIAEAVKRSGADAVCASNTLPALMGIDLETFIPYPNVGGKSTYSGLSGPAVKPISLRVISLIANNVDIPITGTGGPVTWSDAVEFMLVGATTVQFCTAVMHYGFDIIDDLCMGLSNYLEYKQLSSPMALIGKSLPYIVNHDELPRPNRIVSSVNTELCIKDDLCYIVCRDGGHQAIKLQEDRLPVIDEEKCVGCNLCVIICPVANCMKLKPIV